jgi:hypothetical protein
MGMQGWRKSMEDAHIAHLDLPGGVSLFGVFDGHGGKANFINFVWEKKHIIAGIAAISHHPLFSSMQTIWLDTL